MVLNTVSRLPKPSPFECGRDSTIPPIKLARKREEARTAEDCAGPEPEEDSLPPGPGKRAEAKAKAAQEGEDDDGEDSGKKKGKEDKKKGAPMSAIKKKIIEEQQRRALEEKVALFRKQVEETDAEIRRLRRALRMLESNATLQALGPSKRELDDITADFEEKQLSLAQLQSLCAAKENAVDNFEYFVDDDDDPRAAAAAARW